MRTTVNLPDNLYQQSETLAASRGSTVEELIVEAVAKEVRSSIEPKVPGMDAKRKIELPIIHSRQPGTLNLSDFNFDDLLT
jgi:hypothetical protein